jgi:hypothetical protein
MAKLYAAGSPGIEARLELIAGDLAASRRAWSDAVAHYLAAQMLLGPNAAISATVAWIQMAQLRDVRASERTLQWAFTHGLHSDVLRIRAGELYLYYMLQPAKAVDAMHPAEGFHSAYGFLLAASAYLGVGDAARTRSMLRQALRLDSTDADIVGQVWYLTALAERCDGTVQAAESAVATGKHFAPSLTQLDKAMTEPLPNRCPNLNRFK